MAKQSSESLSDDFCLSSLFNEAEESSDLSCDDLYFSLLFNETGDDREDDLEDSLLPDSFHAKELQFQESMMASLLSSQKQRNDPASAGGESSTKICELCVEDKASNEMFTIPNCNHLFCTDCVSKHVMITIQETGVVKCPGLDCRSTLDIDSCIDILPKDTATKWADVLCESLIPLPEKFYCPYRDCSAMIVKDSGEIIRESECPFCRRLFCAECNVPWHPAVECEEFQRLNENERGREDLMVYELAKAKNWRRCPRCKFYVEKTEGCLHMSCRCRFEFCYACGETWTSNHGSCRTQ